MIFDAHVHPFFNIMTATEMGPADRHLQTPELLTEMMSENQIDGALLLSKSGQQLVDFGEAIDGVYGMYWTAPRPPSPTHEFPDYVDEVAHWLEQPKIVGIKLHSLVDGFNPNWPMMDPLYDLAAQLGVAMIFHTGHEYQCLPWQIGKAAGRHPKAKFVMAHMGLHTIEYVEAAIDIAEATPNIYVDTAAMPFAWKIKEAVQRIGEDRVMYGSDAPFFTPKLEIEKVKLSGLTDGQLERVFGLNALEIYFNDANRPSFG